MNIQVRDVPEQVRDALAEAAKAKGQSMQTYLKNLLEEDAQRINNVVLLQRLEAVGGGYVGSASDAADEIAALRAQRDQQISETL